MPQSRPVLRRVAGLTAVALAVGLVPFVAGAPNASAASTDLFFSESFEGTSNTKALAIYNGTGVPVDLAAGGYSIAQYTNGAATPSLAFNLTGTIAPGDVFVFAHALASPEILAQADQTSSAGLFNGNDALALRKGGTTLDVIGQIGVDPGAAGWGTDPTNTTDNTIRRKPTITEGDPNGADAFDPAV